MTREELVKKYADKLFFAFGEIGAGKFWEDIERHINVLKSRGDEMGEEGRRLFKLYSTESGVLKVKPKITWGRFLKAIYNWEDASGKPL